MVERVARVMAIGAKRYGEYNWMKGFSWGETLNHLEKHINAFKDGCQKEDHLAHAVCNLAFLIEYERSHPELCDVPTRPQFKPENLKKIQEHRKSKHS